ncbi:MULTISPECIES: 2-C-methyl-D-erythritol 4-phosphate cytidylyltransferase [unclassified Synechocystis]|uniref:2-C-methyl-D-erythritol 4-phosphate cytidylyltransferase n=1 Tax=unclassified Synechocystis TaxID=2640012 RepID=UPI0003F5F1D2|nr:MULTISPECIES: 2-C-methyl-D-erythritol 4-phosphate cytidylyltransferase [unclassified Synechocystis]AIE75807.1 2-C-methyl-D-erythritol 4-phosphate cytidylyltransferase [Synechocystis sp. PCC 6714]MCT0255259.1 2-C-methyl-D-erythritol 4-phosphate cytidylyltransferase [Synechocystis sp. CS-94]
MHLLIPAAGSGKRMGSSQNKLLLNVLGQPLLSWTVQAALTSQSIEWIGIIGQTYDFPAFETLLTPLHSSKPVQLIVGGDTRQQSVFNGIQALPQSAKFVLIHDGARCLATPDLFDRCTEALQHCQGLIAAMPVKDTIKIVDSAGWIIDTPDRQGLWGAQTPQGFDVALLKACHEKGKQEGWEVTDDAALLEKCGQPVKILQGEDTNLKITTPVDLAIAEFILGQRLAKSA